MRLYKYLASRYVDGILSGDFYFGHMTKYQLLELLDGDRSRGDLHDGYEKTIVSATVHADSKDSNVAELARGLGLAAGSNTQLNLVGTSINSHADAVIYCVSSRPPDNPPPIASDCDACIAVTDWRAFGETLLHKGRVKGSNVPLHEAFRAAMAPVRYERAEPDFQRSGVQVVDPFVKCPSYRAQSEHRLVLTPFEPSNGADVMVHCPEAVQHIERVPLQGVAAPEIDCEQPKEPVPSTLEACDAELNSIWQLCIQGFSERMFVEDRESAQKDFERMLDERYRKRVLACIVGRRVHAPNSLLDKLALYGQPVAQILQNWSALRNMKA
ncbi:MAG: hypothetical protein EPO09_21665 [Aquabacterium sp.]|uniref:hypothetical protein n=1 Tax=Aquabacterium sp. TaxID=1872578 RepID=UPI001217FB11|nr:hypothetical protein [Aquabacterium sp.]TAK82207.1 MAG: hypothetical protein EPO09_21665 [Aquabacterium sp.]